MSFTKVAPAGIGTEPGNSILIGDSLLHSTGIDIGSNTGIGVTIRKHGDATFTGIITAANISAASSVTATEFYGDGSNLDGVSSSGIGTALSEDELSSLNKIYYVNQELSIGSTVTVNHPDSAVASYTHYQDLVVKDDADFIVADGDTFIPDVLGIRTSTSTASAATGGRIRAGTITNAGANGAVNFPNGLVGTSATFTGVLTYEDVTNVDSIGIVTARGGIRIGTGGTVGPVGSGIVTYFGDGSQLSGISGGDSISEGNTKVEAVDTGSDGHVKITTEGSEKLRIKSDGKVNITTGGTLSGGHPPGDLNIVGTNFITMTPNDNANASDNEVLGQVSFLPYGAGSIAAASAKIEAVAESGQSGSSNATSLRFYTKPSSAGPGNSGTERLQIASDGNLILQPYNPGSGIFYPYMNVLNGQIKKYMQVKILNSGQGTKFTFTGTDRTSALITIKVSHSWTASNTSNRHGSAIYAVRIFTANGGSAGWDGITLIQAYGYSTGNFVLSNESGYGYSIKVNNPLSDDGVSFCYDIEVMSASNTSKHSLTSVTIA